MLCKLGLSHKRAESKKKVCFKFGLTDQVVPICPSIILFYVGVELSNCFISCLFRARVILHSKKKLNCLVLQILANGVVRLTARLVLFALLSQFVIVMVLAI